MTAEKQKNVQAAAQGTTNQTTPNPEKQARKASSTLHYQNTHPKHTATLVFVLLLSLFFVQAISATRTTVTTVVVDDDESSNQAARDCRKEVQDMDFKQCEQFLEGSTRSAALVNFLRQGGSGEEKPSTEQLKSCCDQLQKVDPQCQCDAFARVITKHGGGCEGEEGTKIKEMEKAVLSECGLIRCEIPKVIGINTWRF